MDPLSRQLEVWTHKHKWDKIIRAIEKLKPKGRTSYMNALLARAYLQMIPRIDTKDRESARALKDDLAKKALIALASCSQETQRTAFWNSNMAGALINLFRYGEAANYLANALAPEDKSLSQKQKNTVAEWLYMCDIMRRWPVFPETFEKRVAKAWETFEKLEAGIRQRLNQNLDRQEFQDISNDCINIIGIAMTYGACVVRKTDKRNRLFLMGSGNLLSFFEAEYFSEHAPQNIPNNWDISVGAPPKPLQKDELENKNTIYNEARLWVDEKNDIFYIKALTKIEDKLDISSNPGMQALLSKELAHWTKRAVFSAVISELLGDVAMSKFIKISDILDEPLEGTPIKLTELDSFLKSHGVDIHKGSKELLNKVTTYTFYPQEEDKNTFNRDDIISGQTVCMPLLIDFKNGQDDSINKLEADGAVAGYIFYGLDNFVSNNREEEIVKFRNILKKRLMNEFGENSLKIIGEAHGLTNDYIDLMLWNPNKVFDGLKRLLTGLPISYSGFKVFRKSAQSVCLSGKENFIKTFLVKITEPEDILNLVDKSHLNY